MNFPTASLIALGVGACVAMVGAILLLVAAFRQSIVWGLVALFVPFFGGVVYTCVHWAEARAGFLANILGTGICMAGLYTMPMVQERFWQFTGSITGGHPPVTVASLDIQIQQQRQKLEELRAAFAQDGAELNEEYRTLEAQRKALKPADTASITKFNQAAAAYQARNLQRKQMQQEIDAAQKQLEALLEARTHAAAPPSASTHKVVMYTTSHCPACKAAKQYLAQKGVPYEEIDVEASREGAEAFRKLGGRGVPLILVGDKKMEGFSPQALDTLL